MKKNGGALSSLPPLVATSALKSQMAFRSLGDVAKLCDTRCLM